MFGAPRVRRQHRIEKIRAAPRDAVDTCIGAFHFDGGKAAPTGVEAFLIASPRFVQVDNQLPVGHAQFQQRCRRFATIEQGIVFQRVIDIGKPSLIQGAAQLGFFDTVIDRKHLAEMHEPFAIAAVDKREDLVDHATPAAPLIAGGKAIVAYEQKAVLPAGTALLRGQCLKRVSPLHDRQAKFVRILNDGELECRRGGCRIGLRRRARLGRDLHRCVE